MVLTNWSRAAAEKATLTMWSKTISLHIKGIYMHAKADVQVFLEIFLKNSNK